jgi:hypothetical protein
MASFYGRFTFYPNNPWIPFPVPFGAGPGRGMPDRGGEGGRPGRASTCRAGMGGGGQRICILGGNGTWWIIEHLLSELIHIQQQQQEQDTLHILEISPVNFIFKETVARDVHLCFFPINRAHLHCPLIFDLDGGMFIRNKIDLTVSLHTTTARFQGYSLTTAKVKKRPVPNAK